MKKYFSVMWLAVAAAMMLSLPACSPDDNQPEIDEPVIPGAEIVKCTDCGSFWRYDFTYGTLDTDGKTPVVLSAAIFMTPDVYEKNVNALGCGLMNHYTFTASEQRPTNVSNGFTLEGILTNSNYIMIESDGFGFGADSLRNQRYLQGRATARVNIDAFIAGRNLMKEEGFEFGDAVLNLGYSQGGHSGMWVNRLVAEGYRSDELPKIDYCVIGGGPYDMYSHYRFLVSEKTSQYPVALPLILSGMIDASGYKVKYEDVLNADLVPYLSDLFDSKLYNTDYINDFLYERYGTAEEKSLLIEKMVQPAFFDEESEPMKEIVHHLKENSLVYDSWKPSKTDRITFIHSKMDEVVPYLNQEKMEAFLTSNGYTAFEIDADSDAKHTDTGIYYVLKTAVLLNSFATQGQVVESRKASVKSTYDIYGEGGGLIMGDATLLDAYRTLPDGVYVINGKKAVKNSAL
ncbi:MAG: hypothetical protein ACI4TM_04390 [Candidatus Cryptobacteroides sp.]